MNLRKFDNILACLRPLLFGSIAAGLAQAFPLPGLPLIFFGATYAISAGTVWGESAEYTVQRAIMSTHILAGISLLLWGIGMCFPAIAGFGFAGAAILALVLFDRHVEQVQWVNRHLHHSGVWKHAVAGIPLIGCIFLAYFALRESPARHA